MEAKGITSTATSSVSGIVKGAGAGLILGLAQQMFGPLLGTLLGSIVAGLIIKSQRETIALLAGWMLVAGMVGSAQATAASSADSGVL
jgi:hypothetical protein